MKLFCPALLVRRRVASFVACWTLTELPLPPGVTTLINGDVAVGVEDTNNGDAEIRIFGPTRLPKRTIVVQAGSGT